MNELAAIAFFVVTGWVALWPARHCLGAAGYHICALPMGVLSAALAGSFSTVTGRPLDLASAAAGAVVLAALSWSVMGLAAGRAECSHSVGVGSFLIAGGAIGALSLALGVIRLTVSNNDSVVSYWPLGVQLARTGAFTGAIAATRSALIPSMNAIHVDFGSDWAYVIYPMLGATMLLWLAHTLLRGPLVRASRKTAGLVAGGAMLALVLEPSFIFHSLFVHSHMVSALYLLMSLTCVWLAGRQDHVEEPGSTSVAYLLLAGAFAAGFALGRPDGLAYQFVPVAAAIAVLTQARVEWRKVLAFFGPLLLVEGLVYAATYYELGMWQSAKLSGGTTLAILGVLALSAAAPWIVRGLEGLTGLKVSGERFHALLVSVALAVTVAALALKWGTAEAALATARINLFQGAGRYSYVWYAVVTLLILSALTRDALRPASWTRSPFLSIVLFFAIAALVHGLSHEGRVGYGDSLNRVAFHAIPVTIWFVAAIVARILGPMTGAEERAAAQAQAN